MPTSVARVINSALALNAEQRFVSANAVRSALEYAVGGDMPVFEEKPEVEAPLAAAAPEMSPQSAAEETFSALDAFRSGKRSRYVMRRRRLLSRPLRRPRRPALRALSLSLPGSGNSSIYTAAMAANSLVDRGGRGFRDGHFVRDLSFERVAVGQ